MKFKDLTEKDFKRLLNAYRRLKEWREKFMDSAKRSQVDRLRANRWNWIEKNANRLGFQNWDEAGKIWDEVEAVVWRELATWEQTSRDLADEADRLDYKLALAKKYIRDLRAEAKAGITLHDMRFSVMLANLEEGENNEDSW